MRLQDGLYFDSSTETLFSQQTFETCVLELFINVPRSRPKMDTRTRGVEEVSIILCNTREQFEMN